jgi:hypothetical protein
MLIDKEIEITLNASNIKYYKDLGYELPYHLDNRKRQVYKGEKIIVPVLDVQSQSLSKITVKCDYCGNNYTTKIIHYNNGHKDIDKDCCYDCRNEKTTEIYIQKYNTKSIKTRSEILGFDLGRKKHNGNFIYEEFINKGTIPKFIPNEYCSVYQNLPFICKNHFNEGIQYRTYDSIRNLECACKFCNVESSQTSKRYSYDSVKSKFNEKGYVLLTDIYKNVDQNLKYICTRHEDYGIQETTFWKILESTNNCIKCRYEMQSGELHYNWHGGISSAREQFKNTNEYKIWRKEVFKRDNYKCKCCGTHSNNLEAHHLWNYSIHPELRTDINNGITLCFKCHSINYPYSFHSIYTQFNNTPSQLEEYIQRYKNGEFVSKLADIAQSM